MNHSRSFAQVPISTIFSWIAIAGWTALIFALSGEGFAAPETEGFFGPLLRWLIPNLSDQGLAAIHFAIRKTAHAGEYAVLALLSYRALAVSGVSGPARQLGIALGVGLAVAVSDETLQAFSPARGGSAADVALDVTGTLAALALVFALRRWPPVARWLPAAPLRSEA
jgi:VanZ family protein